MSRFGEKEEKKTEYKSECWGKDEEKKTEYKSECWGKDEEKKTEYKSDYWGRDERKDEGKDKGVGKKEEDDLFLPGFGEEKFDDSSVILITKENEHIEVKRRIAEKSKLIKSMEGDVIPLHQVTSAQLRKIITFLEHHIDNPPDEIPKPIESANVADFASDWDVKYIDIPDEEIFELILAANYLDIEWLLNLSCAKVASLIKNKTPEQIRERFNIKDDLTEEEKRTMRGELDSKTY